MSGPVVCISERQLSQGPRRRTVSCLWSGLGAQWGEGAPGEGAADAEVQLLPCVHRERLVVVGLAQAGHGSADVCVRDGAEAGPEHHLLATVGLVHDRQHRIQHLRGPGGDAHSSPGRPPLPLPPASHCPPLRSLGLRGPRPPPSPQEPGLRGPRPPHPLPCVLTPFSPAAAPTLNQEALPPGRQEIPATKSAFLRRVWGGGQHLGNPPAMGGKTATGEEGRATDR